VFENSCCFTDGGLDTRNIALTFMSLLLAQGMADTRRIRDLLLKTEHYDADERFMATNDLIKELEKVSVTVL
jgi:hypothetical protein